MPRTLSLDSLLDNNEEVYIRNIHKPRGIIVLSLTDRSGKPQREVIPNTKVPINLNNRLTPDTIKNSADLRRLLSDGVLELVDQKEATHILEDPSKREELAAAYRNATGKHVDVDKIRGLEEEETANSSDTHIQGLAVVAGKADEIQERLKMAAENAGIDDDDEEDPGVQIKVKTLIAQLSANPPEIKNREAKYQLSTLDLTREDLYYIIENTSSGVVNKYAKEQLAVMTGEPISDDNDEE